MNRVSGANMVRGSRIIGQGARLRDQVYQQLREELQSEQLKAGQRLVELELATRYGVSRTPVREALLQLSREGLLAPHDRGYIVPLDTQKDVIDRLEVRRLLDGRLVRHAATDATDEEIKALARIFNRARTAHETGRAKVFIEAHNQFRATVRAMCRNVLLGRCAGMVDDVFQMMRNQIHQAPENRAITLACDEKLLTAIQNRDPDGAEAAINAFLDALHGYFST